MVSEKVMDSIVILIAILTKKSERPLEKSFRIREKRFIVYHFNSIFVIVTYFINQLCFLSPVAIKLFWDIVILNDLPLYV
jgi:hypothetical protein